MSEILSIVLTKLLKVGLLLDFCNSLRLIKAEKFPLHNISVLLFFEDGGGRVDRRCWVNFQCRGVLLVWMTVGQVPIALAVGAGGGLFGHFFSHLSFLFSFSLILGDGPI